CDRGVDVRVLVIDPVSEQAKIRSLREHLLQRGATVAGFTPRKHAEGKLYRDTTASINYIKNTFCNTPNFKGKKYYSASENFVFEHCSAGIVVEDEPEAELRT